MARTGICNDCKGTGEVPGTEGNPVVCPSCLGLGTRVTDPSGVLQDIITAQAAQDAKIDAIKAMLDSTVYGMQKISSNLDDIMVKLDV